MKRTRLAALALVLSLASAACSDDPEPKLSPPESTSPAPTETETTSEPPEPEKLSPEETVRAWVEAQNLLLTIGDATDLHALGPDCPSCDDLVEPVEETYAAGGSYKTAGWRIVSLKTQKRNGNSAEVAAAIRFTRGHRIPEPDADPVPFGAEKNIMVFELTRRSGTWQVTLVGFVP